MFEQNSNLAGVYDLTGCAYCCNRGAKARCRVYLSMPGTLVGQTSPHLQGSRDLEGVELPRGALDGLVQRVRVARSADTQVAAHLGYRAHTAPPLTLLSLCCNTWGSCPCKHQHNDCEHSAQNHTEDCTT